MLSRFDTIPERDRRTDGRTDRRTDGRTEFLYQYRPSALLCWRSINKCIGDDTKAAVCRSRNCIKKQKKIKYGKKRFSVWRMELLHPAMWHDYDIDFARWLHPAMWHSSGIMTVNSPSGSILQCDTWLWDDMPLNLPGSSTLQCDRWLWDMSWNSPKRPPY